MIFPASMAKSISQSPGVRATTLSAGFSRLISLPNISVTVISPFSAFDFSTEPASLAEFSPLLPQATDNNITITNKIIPIFCFHSHLINLYFLSLPAFHLSLPLHYFQICLQYLLFLFLQPLCLLHSLQHLKLLLIHQL